MFPFMFPFFFHQEPRTKDELQRENIAREAKELKEALKKMTPEERAKFWAEIEGKGEGPEEHT